MKLFSLCIITALLGFNVPLLAQSTWQDEFAKMPLTEKVHELDRSNCVKIVLGAFKRNPAVKALIFMPGATDEFYFFRQARATLTNSSPTLFDAICALTNQTFLRATYRAPFLLLHTAEDPLEPVIVVQDEKTAQRLHRKHFERHAVFNDRDWNFVQPLLDFYLNTQIHPITGTHDSSHFFRHSFAEFDLNGWDALRAVALAGKTGFTVGKRKVTFTGDDRYLAEPRPPANFLNDKAGF